MLSAVGFRLKQVIFSLPPTPPVSGLILETELGGLKMLVSPTMDIGWSVPMLISTMIMFGKMLVSPTMNIGWSVTMLISTMVMVGIVLEPAPVVAFTGEC